MMLRGMGCLELSDKTSSFVKARLILNVAIFGGIPFAVMVFVYFRIFKISRLQNKRGHLGNPPLFSMKKSGMTAKWLKAISKIRTGHLHDDVVLLLKLPESFSVLLSQAN